jgi:hypothetical protein
MIIFAIDSNSMIHVTRFYFMNLEFLSLQIHRYRNSDFPHFRPSTDQVCVEKVNLKYVIKRL